MAYPGDSTLAPEVQTRILSTFRQALRLGDENRREEGILSCDFVLRLDPQFEPAHALKRRLEDAEAQLELDDLLEIVAGASVESDDELVVGDDLLSLDLGVGGDDAGTLDVAAGEPAPIDLDDGIDDGFDSELSLALSHLDPVADEPEGTDGADEEKWPATPAAETDTSPGPTRAEADERIAELLGEGQTAFDGQQYQQAIDAWSRIFLIDIDHVEASRLIEKARQLKAEAERELDEVLHEGISHLEAGEDQLARDAFERILALQPNHLVAKEYLEELQQGSLGLDPGVAEAGVSLDTPQPAIEPTTPGEPVAGGEKDEATTLAAADGASETAPAPRRPTARRKTKKKGRNSFLLIGSTVLILALVGGWYLFGHWQGMFPNSASDSTTGAAPSTADPFQRARALQAGGQTELAVKLLDRLPLDDPNYDAAQALIAQFQAAEETPPEPVEEGLSQETVALLLDLDQQARQAYGERRYLVTELILNRIAELEPLSNEQAAIQVDVRNKLAPLKEQIELIRQGEWETAVPQLWRLLEEKRSDQDILKLLVDGYFNLGVRDLQRGKPEEAGDKFQEALTLAPADMEIQRLRDFSQAYANRAQDLRYRIFIKYLPFR